MRHRSGTTLIPWPTRVVAALTLLAAAMAIFTWPIAGIDNRAVAAAVPAAAALLFLTL
jgi:hypothetical protein